MLSKNGHRECSERSARDIQWCKRDGASDFNRCIEPDIFPSGVDTICAFGENEWM